jgi:hypothetical protein
MAITVLGFDGNPMDQNSIEGYGIRFLRTLHLLKLSGNYPTGGDLLDLTNGGGSLAAPVAIPINTRGLASVDVRPFCKTASSFSAADGQYFIIAPGGVTPISLANCALLKLKLMLDIGIEYTAGAYGADALADMLILECLWGR